MNRFLLSILFFTFLALPVFVSADIVASTPITSDTTWSPGNGVYFIDSYFYIASGATLTIEPGTIIKSRATGMGGPSIYGKLIARGTAEKPIYFTSLWNDNLGGDTDGYGPSVGTPGEWQGLYFKPGSEGILEHIDLSYSGYGGYGYGNYVGIENDGGTLNISHSNIHDNFRITSDGAGGIVSSGTGIYNKSGTLTVSYSIINNCTAGIVSESGTLNISNNIIKNNIDSTGYGTGFAIGFYGFESLILLNNTFINNGRTGSINISNNFIHSGNTSADLKNRGFEINGPILGNTILSNADLPYIIQAMIIRDGGTLTLEPGVIIKMSDYYSTGSLYVQNGGNLIAKGTKEKPIYFTSLKDDSIGGDTNGDGTNSTPSPKNWASIFLENGSKAEFDNVTVSYGGYNWNGEYMNIAAAVYQRGAEFLVNNSSFHHNRSTDIFQDAGTTNIKNSEFKNSDYGIWSRGGTVTVFQSNLTNHAGLAIYNEGSSQIDARNNWWGSVDGPKDLSVNPPTSTGDGIYGNILYIPFLTSWQPVAEDHKINPVIIIPGIMGSAKKNGQWVIDPILHTYDDLIATLEANGYQKDKNLFTFPYEWRDSNVQTANLLKEKISAVKSACEIAQGAGAISQTLGVTDCSKVDIVAHSMGGLVAREYIQSGQYQNDIDQLIFLGTPHKGSPKAYLQWEAGEFLPGLKEFLIQQFFTSEARKNGYKSVYEYIHLKPILSVQELLPIFDYLEDKETGIMRKYPSNYPRNDFLENLNENTTGLINSGVKISNLIGNTGNNTLEKIGVTPSSDSEKWVNGKAEELFWGIGDRTVTSQGSELHNSIENEEWNGTGHNDLPRETSARIYNILTEKIAETVIIRSWAEDLFSIHLQSPIDVLVTAPDGKRMGKNFATGEEYNEIPFAFYSGYQNGNEEYITIPNPLDGDYKIEVQGTGNGGEYGVVTSYISEEVSAASETAGVTKPNQITELKTVINNENPESLETERKINLEIFLSDINSAYDLGWIKDKKTRDALIKQVKLAIKFENKNGKYEKKVDKIILKLFEKELNLLLKKNKINQQAFDLLISDAKYLLENN